MLTTLHSWLQKILHPVANILFDDGVRAIHVTLCAGLISVAVGVLVAAFAFYPWMFLLIPVWMLIRMLFNAVENVLAGEFGQHSRLSTCAHELSTVVAETALFLPFAVIPKVSLLLVLLVTLLAILSEFAGLLGPAIKASRRRDGPMKQDIRMLFNAIESVLTGEFGQHSRLSTCAHELSTVVAETALFLPFAVIPKVSLLLVLLVTLLAIFSEFAGLLGPAIKASRRLDGPMKHDLRMLCFAIFGVGIGSGYVLTAPINIALAVMAILLLVTISKRIRGAVAEVTKPVVEPEPKVYAQE
jgi:CDP-diacylglycerol---glycerol-3-phosphate 3-phosphatidyltransferase